MGRTVKQLSGLDATFLYLETPQMPMHVGALHLLELPAGSKGSFAPALRRHIASRLAVAPPLRRKLKWPPLKVANPVWEDAEPDLRRHIVSVKLPAGSGMADVERKVGELHAQLLDRERPLWKFHVIEGLPRSAEGRRRVALYTQVHHAAVDGQAAVALASAIFDLEPQPAVPTAPARRSKSLQIGFGQLMRGAVGSQADQWLKLLKGLPDTVGALTVALSQSLLRSVERWREGGEGGFSMAPRTRLNASVTEGRAFAAVSLPLAELKALAKAHQATLNDLVLMLCSTALRRHFGRHGPLPRKSLVAAVPVSLRAKGDANADNQASMSLIALGTDIADPVKRLAHIKAASASMKETMSRLKQVLPTDFPSLGVPWLMQAVTTVYGRAKVAERIPPLANVAVSNVPGPPVPLYIAGARMLANHPTSIVVHGVGLNITVQSYDRSLDFGLMACAQAMPDVRELADAILIAYDDLKTLPTPEDATASRGLVDAVSSAARSIGGRVLKAGLAQVVSNATRLTRANAPAKGRRGR